MRDNNNRWANGLSRRQWMKLASAGSATLLAGCGGDGGDEDATATETETETMGEEATETATEDGGDQEISDLYFNPPAVGNIADFNGNLWSNNFTIYYALRFNWESLAQFVPQTLEYEPWLATDWAKEGDTVTVDIKEGYSWHSGEDFTAEDVANHFKVGELGGMSAWDFTDSVQAASDYTVEFTLQSADPNPTVVLNTIINEFLFTHPELHSEFLERREDASTEDEMDQISQDLLNYKITAEEAYETFGNGPVQLTSAEETTLIFDRYEDHPDIDNMPWQGVRIDDFGSTEAAFHEAAIADEIDCFTGSTTEQVRNEMPDHWELVPTPSLSGDAIHFSPNSMWGQDTEESRHLRRAIAFLYNPSTWRQIYGENVTNLPEPNMVTAMPTAEDSKWIPDDILESLTDYGSEENGWARTDMAAQELQAAGYERNNNDVWAKDGEPLSVGVKFPAGWSGLLPVFNNIAEQFNDFGIQAEPLGQENTNYFGSQLPNHDFELAVESFGGDTGFPFQSFRDKIGGISDPSVSYNNERSEVTVPWPPGDPENDLQTVNIDDRIQSLSTASGEEEVQEITGELAWIVNQWVHLVEVEDRLRMHYIATNRWNYDIDRDDPIFHSEQFWAYLTRTGQLKPAQ